MVGVIVLVHGGSRQARRMVKIFELAFTQEVTPLAWPALRLVFRSSFTHTQRQERRQSLKGEPMDWKHLLAYITGTVDQELLVRNELWSAKLLLPILTSDYLRLCSAVLTSSRSKTSGSNSPPTHSNISSCSGCCGS
jgi:hypothetical protein